MAALLIDKGSLSWLRQIAAWTARQIRRDDSASGGEAMRYVLAMLLMGSGAADAEEACPAKQGDQCRAQADRVCRWQSGAVKSPPWSTPEQEQKKRDKDEKALQDCRARHPEGAPSPKPDPLPPWRKK
jgi:hypothetical protein